MLAVTSDNIEAAASLRRQESEIMFVWQWRDILGGELKKIPPFSRITTTIYCRSDPGLTAMHDKLNKYICAAFQRWPVVVQWVSVAPTLSGWTFVVRFAIFLHHNMPFPFVSSSFSSRMQHHHQHRKDQKCKSHAMYSFPWKIYSRNHFPDFFDQIQDYISLIANSLFLYLATLVQVLNLQWLRTLPPSPTVRANLGVEAT